MLLDRLILRNLLSFRDATVEPRPLNIPIGENTAGKSNVIQAIGLLQSLPSDFRAAIFSAFPQQTRSTPLVFSKRREGCSGTCGC